MTQRFNTLDGLRGVAAIAVMFFHFTQHTSFRIFSGAGLAVDLFFCMSGFVIAYSYQHRFDTGLSLGDFFTRRVVRLYPMFLIGLGLGALALGLKIHTGQSNLGVHGALAAVGLNALYIPYLGEFYVQMGKDAIPSAIFPTNDPAWSLFFELLVNVLFALIMFWHSKKNPLSWVLLGAVALIAYVVLSRQIEPGWSSENLMGGFYRTFFGFFAGVYIYYLRDRIRKYVPRMNPAYLVMASIFLLLLPTRFADPLWLPCVLIAVPLLIVLGTFSEPQSQRTDRIFDYIGWLSYPLYCVHYPVYSIYTSITGNANSGISGALICAPIAIALAHLAGKFIDEPLRAALSRRLVSARKIAST